MLRQVLALEIIHKRYAFIACIVFTHMALPACNMQARGFDMEQIWNERTLRYLELSFNMLSKVRKGRDQCLNLT